MHGEFCWNELLTRDVEGAKRFYAEVFGWGYEVSHACAEGPYVVAFLEGRPVAGIYDISDAQYEGLPPHWFAYIATEDVDAAIAAAVAAGAKPIREAFAIEGVGRFGLLTDPAGAAIGFFEPAQSEGCGCGEGCGCH